jgi:hypothetical protein
LFFPVYPYTGACHSLIARTHFKYLRMETQQTASPDASQSPYPMKTSSVQTRAAVFLCIVVALLAGSASAQTPRIAVAAGYSFLRFDSSTIGFADYTNLQGANGSLTYNLTPSFGVTAEVAGQYGEHLQVSGWMVGPQVYHHFLGADFFAHGLFGQAQTRVEIGTAVTNTGRALAGGGGIDIPVSARFSIRAIQADFINTQTFNVSQNNLRFSTGLVFRWGAVRKNRSARKMPTP